MSILGIVVEYNPLHNGHIYHINSAKNISKCDEVVAVMSGNFVQRGEPAIINKWERTKMALMSGVDLVIELPVIYSTSTAENFAYGAIKLLDSLKIIDYICFGTEKGDLDEIYKIAEILKNEPSLYKKYLKEFLNTGLTYALAREQAIKKFTNNDMSNILQTSNNILAIEYVKSLLKLNSNIKPLTIKRVGNMYNSLEITGNFISASSARKQIYENNINNIKKYIPDYSYEILTEAIKNGICPISFEDFSNIIFYKLRKKTNLKNIFDVSEGLENKIYNSANLTNNFSYLVELIKSKRYTKSRIRRILTHTLLEIKNEMYQKFDGPNYIRVLGFNNKGLKILNALKKKSSLPIITKVSNYKKILNNYEMFEKDLFATDIYTLAYKNSELSRGNLDFTHPIIKI